jgi:hypothetical protein
MQFARRPRGAQGDDGCAQASEHGAEESRLDAAISREHDELARLEAAVAAASREATDLLKWVTAASRTRVAARGTQRRAPHRKIDDGQRRLASLQTELGRENFQGASASAAVQHVWP